MDYLSTGDNMKTPTLAALGYRLHKGCKQYAFEEIESLKKWTKRHPYKNELLRIILFKENRLIADKWMPAPEVSDWLDTITACDQNLKPV